MKRRYIPLAALLFSCGGGGGGWSRDTMRPNVSLNVPKTQYDLGEDVMFTGSSSDNVGVVAKWIDVNQTVDLNMDGDFTNDADLPSLNGTYRYWSGGKYIATGWARDAAGNVGLDKEMLIVKPHKEFEEVQDSKTELLPLTDISIPISSSDWGVAYIGLGPQAKAQISPLQSQLIGDESIRTVQLIWKNTGNSKEKLLYQIFLGPNSPLVGFEPSEKNEPNDYFGTLAISQTTFNEIIGRIRSSPGPPIIYWGTVNGGTIPDGRQVRGWLDTNGNGSYDATGAFTPDGDEDFNIMGQLTQGGYYGVQIPPDDPRTFWYEGFDKNNLYLTSMRIIIDGRASVEILPLTSVGSYRRDITLR